MYTDIYCAITEIDDVYEKIAGDVEKQFDTLNYDERRRQRLLPVEIKRKK